MVGRSDELDELSELVAMVTGRTGAGAVIEAPPGLGKTTLLRSVAAMADEGGLSVVWAGGGELASTSPWAVAAQLVEGLVRCAGDGDAWFEGPAGRALDLVQPELPPEVGSLFPLVHGVCCALRDAALDTPLLMIVDDAHLVDDESLNVLATLLERIDDAPYGLVIARRTPGSIGGAAVQLDHAISSAGARRLVLEALEEETIGSLVDASLAARSVEQRRDVVRASGGNPLLAREAIEIVGRDDGLAQTLADLIGHDSASIIRQSTLARLGASGEGSLPVTAAIAVLGTHADLARVAAVTGVPIDRTVDAVRQLERNGVIEVEAGTPALRHPFVEQMVIAEVGELRVAQLHAVAAGVLHADGLSAADIVPHLVCGRGSSSAEPWMSPCLREVAARRLALGAPQAAVELLSHALDVATDAVARIEIALELACAEAASGRTMALDRLDEIRPDLDGSGGSWTPTELGLLARVGEAQYAAGHFHRAERTFDRAISSLRLPDGNLAEIFASLREPDSLMVARLLVGRASASLLGGGPSLLDDSIEEMARREVTAPSSTVRLLASMRAGERALGIDVEADTLALLIDTVNAGPTLPDALFRSVYEPIGASLAMSGRVEEAQTLETTLLDAASRRGDVVSHISLLPIRGYAALGQGRVAAALADASDALRLEAVVPSASRYAGAPARYVAAIAYLERDDLDAALGVVAIDDHAERWAGSPMYGWYLVAAGSVALEQNQFDDAAFAFAEAGRAFTAGGGSGSVVAWRSGLARALDRRGDHAAARLHLHDEQAAASLLGDRRLAAESARTSARIDRDHRRAADALADAADLLTGINAPLQLASIAVDHGIRLRRAGDRRSARASLRRGLDLASRFGLRRLQRLATSELEAAGARRPSLSTTGADAVTAAELRVATLVVDGRSNRDVADALFVSVKTVETHLSSMYRKLGIRRRADLGAALDLAPASAT